MSFWVYVLLCKDGKLYKGFTNSIENRLKSHREGRNRWTRNRGPFQLVYKEELKTKQEAQNREKFLKSGQGREFLKKHLSKNQYSGRSSVR